MILWLPIDSISDSWSGYEEERIEVVLAYSPFYVELLSIMEREHVCDPIEVYHVLGDNRLHLENGWHRWSIAKLLKWTHIPCYFSLTPHT